MESYESFGAMGGERRRREALSGICKRKTDGRRVPARGRAVFKEQRGKRKREIVVSVEVIRSLLEKLATVAPCFEGTEGSAHHNGRGV